MTSSDIRRTSIRGLAAEYKARGLSQRRAWSQFVIDRGLKPEVDACDFYLIFRLAEAAAAVDGAAAGEARVPDPDPALDTALPGAEYSEYGRRILVHMESTFEVSEWKAGQIERKITPLLPGGDVLYEVRLDDEYGTRRLRRDDFEYDGDGDEGICWLNDSQQASLAAAAAMLIETEGTSLVC